MSLGRLSCDVLSSLYCTWYVCTFSNTMFLKFESLMRPQKDDQEQIVSNFTHKEQQRSRD